MATSDEGRDEAKQPSSSKTYNYSATYLRETFKKIGAQNVETAIYANVISKDKLDVDAIYSPESVEVIKSIAKTLEISSDTVAFILTFLPCALFGNNVEVYAIRSEPIILNELAFLINSTSLGKSTALNICLKSPCAFVKKFGVDPVLIDECTPHKIDNLLNETNGRATFAIDDLTSKFVASFENRLDNNRLRVILDELFTGHTRNTFSSYAAGAESENIRVLLMGLGHPGMDLQVRSHLALTTEHVANKIISLTASFEPESGPFTKLPPEVNIKIIVELIALGLALGHAEDLIEYQFSKEAKDFLRKIDAENKENLQLFWKLNQLVSKGYYEKKDIPQKALDAYNQPRYVDMAQRLTVHLFITDRYIIRAFDEGTFFNKKPLNDCEIGVTYVKRAMVFLNTTQQQTNEYHRMLKILATQNIGNDMKLNLITLANSEEALARKCLLIPGAIISMSIMERTTRAARNDIIAALSKWMKPPHSRDFIGTLESGTYPNKTSSLYLVKCPDYHINTDVLVKLGITVLEYRQAFFATDDVLRKVHKTQNLCFEETMSKYARQLPNWFPNDEIWTKFYLAAKRVRFLDISDLIELFPPLKEEIDQSDPTAMLEFMMKKDKQKRKVPMTDLQMKNIQNIKIRYLDLCIDGVLLYQTKLEECEKMTFQQKSIAVDKKRRSEMNYRSRQLTKARDAQNVIADLRQQLLLQPYSTQPIVTSESQIVLTSQSTTSFGHMSPEPIATTSAVETGRVAIKKSPPLESDSKDQTEARKRLRTNSGDQDTPVHQIVNAKLSLFPHLQLNTMTNNQGCEQSSNVPALRKLWANKAEKKNKLGSDNEDTDDELHDSPNT